MFLSRLTLVIASLLPLSAGHAHEYWIETSQYQVAPGENMTADLRNGQLFEGTRQGYFPNRTDRFDLSFDGEVVAVEARMGDIPALQIVAPPRDGLLSVVHEAATSFVTYTEWEKFLAFAEHKDFPTVAADHVAAGYSQERFKESYTRHSKALIAIGDGRGADAFMGMATELVALTNPYAADFDNQMEVALSYGDAPRADAQIEVYERDDAKQVTVTKYRTDADGIARFEVTPGMTYLVDAVVLRPAPEAGETPESPVWETLWASLTFAVPQ